MKSISHQNMGQIDWPTIDDRLKYKLISFPGVTGNGASAVSTLHAVVPYDRWRVVAAGFGVVAAGASTVAEVVQFGITTSDFGVEDLDYFGKFSQDLTAGEQLGAGDMIAKIDTSVSVLASVLAPVNAGTHAYAAGSPDGFAAWQTAQGVVTITKNNVALSTATVVGWLLVEV